MGLAYRFSAGAPGNRPELVYVTVSLLSDTPRMYRIGRFAVPTRRRQLVVGLSSLLLIHAAATIFAILGRLRSWRLLSHVQAWWSRAVLRVLDVRPTIEGVEHLRDEPAILLPLHEGFVDVPLLLTLGRSMRFIARDELFEWPQLGRVLRAGGHLLLPTAPTLGDFRSLIADAAATLSEGHDLVIFPQGSILGIEVAFAKGARRIAKQCNVAVVPIVITGTHRVWEYPYSPRLRRGCAVRLEILAPLSAGADLAAWRAMELEMKRLALAAVEAPARRFVPARDGYWDGYAYTIDPMFPELLADVTRHRAQSPSEGGA